MKELTLNWIQKWWFVCCSPTGVRSADLTLGQDDANGKTELDVPPVADNDVLSGTRPEPSEFIVKVEPQDIIIIKDDDDDPASRPQKRQRLVMEVVVATFDMVQLQRLIKKEEDSSPFVMSTSHPPQIRSILMVPLIIAQGTKKRRDGVKNGNNHGVS